MEAPPPGGHDPIPSPQPGAAPAEGEDGSLPPPLLSGDWSQRGGGALGILPAPPLPLARFCCTRPKTEHACTRLYSPSLQLCTPGPTASRGGEAATSLAARTAPCGWIGGGVKRVTYPGRGRASPSTPRLLYRPERTRTGGTRATSKPWGPARHATEPLTPGPLRVDHPT